MRIFSFSKIVSKLFRLIAPHICCDRANICTATQKIVYSFWERERERELRFITYSTLHLFHVHRSEWNTTADLISAVSSPFFRKKKLSQYPFYMPFPFRVTFSFSELHKIFKLLLHPICAEPSTVGNEGRKNEKKKIVVVWCENEREKHDSMWRQRMEKMAGTKWRTLKRCLAKCIFSREFIQRWHFILCYYNFSHSHNRVFTSCELHYSFCWNIFRSFLPKTLLTCSKRNKNLRLFDTKGFVRIYMQKSVVVNCKAGSLLKWVFANSHFLNILLVCRAGMRCFLL